jgi:hypothetical protein
LNIYFYTLNFFTSSGFYGDPQKASKFPKLGMLKYGSYALFYQNETEKQQLFQLNNKFKNFRNTFTKYEYIYLGEKFLNLALDEFSGLWFVIIF